MPDLNPRVVTSADGTAVEYLSVGRGPDVIVIPGVFATAAALTSFAMLLAERHTVHIVQRRGRGGSGPQGDLYGIARECEDVEAVRARTSARLIFGHSYGIGQVGATTPTEPAGKRSRQVPVALGPAGEVTTAPRRRHVAFG